MFIAALAYTPPPPNEDFIVDRTSPYEDRAEARRKADFRLPWFSYYCKLWETFRLPVGFRYASYCEVRLSLSVTIVCLTRSLSFLILSIYCLTASFLPEFSICILYAAGF